MISKKVESGLNKQIELEGYASFLYLSMASWCEQGGLEGSAKFMHRQSNEERAHMLRIFNYINEVDGHAITPAINQPPLQFESIRLLFSQVYEHEKKVTASINSLVDMCYEENDYSTLNFLQWYIQEQREEEVLMRTIIDKIKLIGDGPQSLFYIDNEVEKINKIAEKDEATDETGKE